MRHYYYLHVNGDLIHKRLYPDSSDSVKRIWKLDVEDRKSAWILVIESLALGARLNRVKDLCQIWNCDIKDLINFMFALKAEEINDTLRIGLKRYLEDVCNKNYDKWMDWLESTPPGSEPDYKTMP